MRKIIALIAFFMIALGLELMLSTSVVVAQSTNTPEPTWEPIFLSPTPAPPGNYTCPNGTPIGWGTYTPNPSWNLNCSQCLLTITPQYRTPEPTLPWVTPGTPHGTASVPTAGTPSPSVTPVGSPTPTATSQYGDTAIDCDYITIDNVTSHCEHQDARELANSQTGAGLSGVPVAIQQAIGCMSGGDCSSNKTFAIPYEMSCVGEVSKATAATLGIQIQFTDHNGAIQTFYNHCPSGLYCRVEGAVSGTISSHTWAQADKVIKALVTEYGGLHSGATYSGYCYVRSAVGGWYPTPTPYPTFTATPNYTATPTQGYCGDLRDGGGNPFEDPNLILPVIRKGSPSCVTIEAINLDLSDFPLIGDLIPVIDFPGFQVCFVPILFGTINLLGLSISLDLMASAMAAMVALRILLRS